MQDHDGDKIFKRVVQNSTMNNKASSGTNCPSRSEQYVIRSSAYKAYLQKSKIPEVPKNIQENTPKILRLYSVIFIEKEPSYFSTINI